MIDLTLITVVDRSHLNQLKLNWSNWMEKRPELRTVPAVIAYDDKELNDNDLSFVARGGVKLVPWSMSDVSQREEMLTAYVRMPGAYVTTPWYLKLDTDVVVVRECEWINSSWFKEDTSGRLPVYVSNPWGYTRPSNSIDMLDNWADGVSKFNETKRLDIPFNPDARVVCHTRMASWVHFGLTSWTKEMSDLCPNRLPVPSQDTYLSYCATRLGEHTIRARMRKYGWSMLSRKKQRELRK